MILYRAICLELSPEQLEFQQLARKFAREEILPVAAHHDQTGEYPWEIVKKAHALGLMNGHVPQEYGKPSDSDLTATMSCGSVPF